MLGAFDFKRRCTERSVYDIKVPRETFESIGSVLLSYRSRGTLMSYTDHSVQRRLKSNKTMENKGNHSVESATAKQYSQRPGWHGHPYMATKQE